MFNEERTICFEHEKVLQRNGLVLGTEQGIVPLTFIFQGFGLNFKSTFVIFKEFINDFLNNFRRTTHDGYFC